MKKPPPKVQTTVDNQSVNLEHKAGKAKHAHKQENENSIVSEELYQLLFNYSNDAMFVSLRVEGENMPGKFIEVNDTACLWLGYTRAELLQMTPLDISAPLSTLPENMEVLAKNRQALHVEVHITKAGREIPVEISTKVFELNGRQFNLSIARNVTERRQAETALRASEEQFHALVSNSLDGILLTQPDGQIFSANPAMCKLLGRTEEEIKQLGRAGIIDTTDPRLAAALAERQRTGKFVGELTFVRNDGSRFPVEITSQIYVAGGQQRTSMFVRDITERKQAEEALQVSETRYRRLFETAQDGILILDAESGQVLDVNPFLLKLLGYSHEMLVGRELWEFGLFKDIIASREAFLELQAKKYIRYENLPLETSDGRRANVEFISNVYLEGHTKVIQCNIRDITERKQAETQLDDANQKLEEELSQITALQENLRELSIHDSLTGLYNRRYLDETTERELSRAKRENYPVSVMMIDIDHFKDFNDSYGHKAGDAVLIAFSSLLQANIRQGDIACRYGGDEFVLILPGAQLQDAENRAEKIRKQLNSLSVKHETVDLIVKISLGLAIYPWHGSTVDEIIRAADTALYEAKQSGRDRVHVLKSA